MCLLKIRSNLNFILILFNIINQIVIFNASFELTIFQNIISCSLLYFLFRRSHLHSGHNCFSGPVKLNIFFINKLILTLIHFSFRLLFLNCLNWSPLSLELHMDPLYKIGISSLLPQWSLFLEPGWPLDGNFYIFTGISKIQRLCFWVDVPATCTVVTWSWGRGELIWNFDIRLVVKITHGLLTKRPTPICPVTEFARYQNLFWYCFLRF